MGAAVASGLVPTAFEDGAAVGHAPAIPTPTPVERFSPHLLSSVPGALPTAGVTVIEAPVGGSTGSAQLHYPIELPAGRRGLEPSLALAYDSAEGNGPLGVGWRLELPVIEVDSTFGVPRYQPSKESETYLFEGSFLAPTADLGAERESDRRFVRRVEGSFERIVRRGSDPTSYHWEVTDQDGVVRSYGSQTRLADPSSSTANISTWALDTVTDPFGNTQTWTWTIDAPKSGAPGEPWRQLYPASVHYTGKGDDLGYYEVAFSWVDREDSFTTARQGFVRKTAKRLETIEVFAGRGEAQETVRTYTLAYETGAYGKSLLSSITQHDASGAEVGTHEFTYKGLPTQGERISGFGEGKTWHGLDTLPYRWDAHAGGHAFAGLGDTSCSVHAGIQAGGGAGATATSGQFFDLTGDGIIDRLTVRPKPGGGDATLYAGSFDAASESGSFAERRVANAPPFIETGMNITLDGSVGLHAFQGLFTLAGGFAWNHANGFGGVSDLNGDGFPDMVNTVGGFTVYVNEQGQSFDKQSSWQGYSLAEVPLVDPTESADLLKNFPLADAVRALRLPKAGSVSIDGALTKLAAGGNDGLVASIYLNAQPLWTRTFAADDTTACTPGPSNGCDGGLTATVAADDQLFFVTSSIKYLDEDAVQWQPVVRYAGGSGGTGPTGAPLDTFDAGADFRLATAGQGWVAPATGDVLLAPTLSKRATADDVTFTFWVETGDKDHRHRMSPDPWSVTVPAAQTTVPLAGFPKTWHVETGDELHFAVHAASPIDPARVGFSAKITYSGGEICEGSYHTTTDCHPVACNSQGKCTAGPHSYDEDMLSATAPTAFAPLDVAWLDAAAAWTAPGGSVDLELTWTPGANATGARITAQAANQLLWGADAGSASQTFTTTLSPAKGQVITFQAFLDSDEAEGTLTVKQKKSKGDETLPSQVVRLASPVFSGGYHGWTYGSVNGNLPAFEVPKVPSCPTDEPCFDKAHPPPPPTFAAARPDAATQRFIGPGASGTGVDGEAQPPLYISGSGMNSSRTGGDITPMLADDGLDAASGGPGYLSKSYGYTISGQASFGVGGTLAQSWYETQLELVDLNGDRYPDLAAEGSWASFNNGTDGFELQQFPGLGDYVRRAEDTTAGVSAGIGVTLPRRSSKGKSQGSITTLPSIGATRTYGFTHMDLLDVNGDGLPDRVTMDPGDDKMQVRLNLGYRFGAEEDWTLPKWQDTSLCTDLGPLSHEKKPPIPLGPGADGIEATRTSAYNVGVAVGPIGGGVNGSLSTTYARLADVNGDGLLDHVLKDPSESDAFRVKFNTGTGWAEPVELATGAWPGVPIPGDKLAEAAFHCADGVAYTDHIAADASVGVPVCIPLVPPYPVLGLQIAVSGQVSAGTGGSELDLVDVDGDGLVDQILKKLGSGEAWVRRNQLEQVNLLETVSRPLHGDLTLSYARRGNRVDYSDDKAWVDMPAAVWTLASVVETDGRGNRYTTEWQYADDAYTSRDERQPYGFAGVTEVRPDGSKVRTTFYNQDFYLRGAVDTITEVDAEGRTFTVLANLRKNTPVPGYPASRFPHVDTETLTFYEGGSTPKSTRRTYGFSEYGNLIHYTDFADTGSADDVSVAITEVVDSDAYIVRPQTLTITDSQGTMLRHREGSFDKGELVSLTETLSGGIDPKTLAPYEDYAVTTRQTWTPSGMLASVTDPSGYTLSYGYDAPTGSYVTSVKDGFGYTSSAEWDLRFGQQTSATDATGATVGWHFDDAGRLAAMTAPGASSPTLTMRYAPGAEPAQATTVLADASQPGRTLTRVTFVDGLGRAIQHQASATVDVDGVPTDGTVISGTVGFDARGRVNSLGQPRFTTASPGTYTAQSALNPTTYEHDVLSRVTAVHFPQGASTTVSYDIASFDGIARLRSTRTDAKQIATAFYSAVTGDVVAVSQQGTSGPVRTRYSYSPLRQLLGVEDAKKNVTSLAYDTLGRRVSVDNPDGGETTFAYTPGGDLARKVTAELASKGQAITYTRKWHRLQGIDYPTDEHDVTLSYGEPGAAEFAAGRITEMKDAAGREERGYDALGNLARKTRWPDTHQGNAPTDYTTSFTYGPLGRPLTVRYPNQELLTYGYDAGGRPISAVSTLDGQTTKWVEDTGYDAFGSVVRTELGNGIDGARTYDPVSRLLKTIHAGSFQALSLDYDETGTLLEAANKVPVAAPGEYGGPVTLTFTPDELYRLQTAEGQFDRPSEAEGGPKHIQRYHMTHTYDGLGNIVSRDVTATISPGHRTVEPEIHGTYGYGARPHSPTSFGAVDFEYDDNGNQLLREEGAKERRFTWDEENRPLTVAYQGDVTTLRYDGDGHRASKRGAGGEIVYLGAHTRVRNGTQHTNVIWFAGHRVGLRAEPATDIEGVTDTRFWLHEDWQGSVTYVTDAEGSLTQHYQYLPYGAPWVEQGPAGWRVPFRFTGAELDSYPQAQPGAVSTGLYHMQARLYDPDQAMFVSVDPALDGLLDVARLSQADLRLGGWHASGQVVGYVDNAPADFTDPTGLGKTHFGMRAKKRVPKGRPQRIAKHAAFGKMAGLNSKSRIKLYLKQSDPRFRKWWGTKAGPGTAYPDVLPSPGGVPVFPKRLLYPAAAGQKAEVVITMTGKYSTDFQAGFAAANITEAQAKGYTWHHLDDFNPATRTTTMQLVRTADHQAVAPHRGSAAQWRDYFQQPWAYKHGQ